MMICFEAGDVTFNYRVAGIINRGDEVLLQRLIGDEDFWCLPGGRVELLEPGDVAMRREMREELGLEVEVQRLGLGCGEPLRARRPQVPRSRPLLPGLAAGRLPGVPRPGAVNEEDGSPLLFERHKVSLLADVSLFPTFLRSRLRDLPENIEYIVHRDA